MPRGGKSAAAPVDKDIYLFVIETDEKRRCRPEYTELVTKLLADKIFAESEDYVCVHKLGCRTEDKYETTSWDLLERVNRNDSAAPKSNGSISSCIDAVRDLMSTLVITAENDVFVDRKVLLFGNFDSYSLKKDELEMLKDDIQREDIFLTIVFPDVGDMNEQQEKNYNLAKSVLGNVDGVFIFTVRESFKKVLNIVANRSKRSLPWNATLEIGDHLSIPVQKLILNRKQAIWTLFSDKKTASASGETRAAKQTAWLDSDGTELDASDVGNAYAYGDQLVTIEGIPYESGDSCLKLLVFCPRENIRSAYLVGDGADIFFPQPAEKHPDAFIKFDALLKAMNETNRVAVCRKVYRKNSRVTLCVLVPDLERGGLISTELCFADDISTPTFPPLIKPSDSVGVTDKERAIDDLITQKSISEFSPSRGPVDPSVLLFREYVTQKILWGSDQKPKLRNNIQAFFEDEPLEDALVEKLKAAFPLAVKKETTSDRPSGKQIFRKRKNDLAQDAGDKKVKVVEPKAEETKMEEEFEEPEEDMDALLDEL